MNDVTAVIGAGGIGQAIARRSSSGRHVLLADHRQESADAFYSGWRTANTTLPMIERVFNETK